MAVSTSPEDPELAKIRLWIQRVSRDYEQVAIEGRLGYFERRRHRRKLKELRQAYDGSSIGSSKNTLRMLIAGGAMSYRSLDVISEREHQLPETLMIDFFTHCLWPIITAPKLPENWLENLYELTSPPVGRLVLQARVSRTTGNYMSMKTFYTILADALFAFGIVNLLDDLNDPKRGGSALAAISLGAKVKKPPIGSKKLLVWLCGAGAAGVIGNRADALAVEAWDWLGTHLGDSGHHGSSDHANHDNDLFGHKATNAHKSSEGLVAIIHNFFFGH